MQKSKDRAKFNPQFVKNGAWERLGEVLETGPLQDPQKVVPAYAFLGPFGDMWPIFGATWGQVGAKWRPKGPKTEA